MTITLSPELDARLREQAAREGKEPETLAEALLSAALDWEAQAIAGIRRGLESSAAGRVHPAAELFAEMAKQAGDVQELKIQRPKRAKLSDEETRKRMDAFEQRKEQF